MDSKKTVNPPARNPEARAKHPAARKGKPATEAAPDLERRLKSEALRLRMSERGPRIIDQPGHYEKWTPEELAMLGTIPDREVARLVGRSVSAVRAKRASLREG